MMRETAVLYLELITDFLAILAKGNGFMSRYHPLVGGIAKLTGFIQRYDALDKSQRHTLIDDYYENVCKVSDEYTEWFNHVRLSQERARYEELQRSGHLETLLENQPEAWVWVQYMEDLKVEKG